MTTSAKLTDQALTDYRVATALHEAAHAVTYLSLGRSFVYVSIEESITMGNGEPIDPWDRAVTAMAGPAAESLMANPGADDGVIYQWIIETRNEHLQYWDGDPGDGPGDYIDAGDYGIAALPMALATVESRWDQVEAIAAAALHIDPLPYAQIQELAKPLIVDPERLGEAISRWSSVADNHGEQV